MEKNVSFEVSCKQDTGNVHVTISSTCTVHCVKYNRNCKLLRTFFFLFRLLLLIVVVIESEIETILIYVDMLRSQLRILKITRYSEYVSMLILRGQSCNRAKINLHEDTDIYREKRCL